MTDPKRILIIDPYGVYSLPTADVLEQAGHRYTLVWDRLRALQALQTDGYDLIIVDVRMPAGEMLEMLQMANQHTPRIPVLLYTRKPSLLKLMSEMLPGMTPDLCKFVTPDRLVEEIEKCMAHLPPSAACGVHEVPQGEEKEGANREEQLTRALQETIRVIESTRRSFKSRELAFLRTKLEKLLGNDRLD